MDKEDNLAAWLHGVDDLRVHASHQPADHPLAPNEARVRVGAVGICGSDVHFLKHMRIGDFVVKSPMVIGHESAGTVVEVGTAVTHLKAGDRVAMEPGIPCRCCHLCKGGSYNLCADMAFFAAPPTHGSLVRFVVHPADLCFPLPPTMSLEEGAMCEPLSVAIHACQRARVGPGSRIAVLGGGPIGLVTLQVALAFGASAVVVTDHHHERLALARAHGAAAAIDVSGASADAVATRVVEALGGARPHVTADCVGVTASMAAALAATESGGAVLLIGMGHGQMTVPLVPAAAREVDVLGVFRYRNTYPLAIELIASGKCDVKPLITHRFDLVADFSEDTIKEAFETSARGGAAIKVMFNVTADAADAAPRKA